MCMCPLSLSEKTRLSSRLRSVVHFLFSLLLFSPPHFPFSSPFTDAPKITNKPDDPNIRLTSGGSETIPVRYDKGNPLAMIEWSKDGVSIDNHDSRITTRNCETTFKLTNESLGVTGTYKVRVFNSVGSDGFEYFVEPECKL